MKAVRIHAFGGPELLKYEDAPRPEPAAGEVGIRVRAAGVNPFDGKIRSGAFEKAMAHPLPLILGWDVAGDVAALGPGVTGFAVGDPVYALADYARDGAYAEYLVVAATLVAPKPRTLDYVAAASVPMAAETAMQALYDLGQLQAGQTVLIHGAAGSLGGFAVQLAKLRGAHVIGTALAANAGYVAGLGADQVIDYQAQQFETLVQNADLVLDTQGGEVQARSWQVLRPGGRLVSTVQPATPPADAPAGVRGDWIFVQPSADTLRALTVLIEAGQLLTPVQLVLSLREARHAQELVDAGLSKPGKVVLQVAD